MRDEKAVITHHEAGHAVAALMTVDAELDGPVSASVVAGQGAGNAKIARWVIPEPTQAAFIFYAGPWAEARVQWPRPALSRLDDTDANGRSFHETVTAAFKEGVHFGGASDLAMYTEQVGVDPNIPAREQDWSCELERAWPVIETLANALRDGLQPRPHPYAELPGNECLTMKYTEIAAADVMALVRPLLEARRIWRYVK